MAEQVPLFDEADPNGSPVEGKDGHQRDLRTVELTTREVNLLIEYGYPFSARERKLRTSRAVDGIHRVRMGSYWIEMMLADLVR